MSKFTEGEWSTDWQIHGNGFVRITSTDKSCDEPHVETIADVYICDDVMQSPTMKGMANARLIAYAPEMYELLEDFTLCCACNVCRCADREDTRKKAQELLARINGEEIEQ